MTALENSYARLNIYALHVAGCDLDLMVIFIYHRLIQSYTILAQKFFWYGFKHFRYNLNFIMILAQLFFGKSNLQPWNIFKYMDVCLYIFINLYV